MNRFTFCIVALLVAGCMDPSSAPDAGHDAGATPDASAQIFPRSGLIAIQWSCWQRSGSHDPAEIMSADTLVIDAFDRTFAFEGCRDCPRTGELLPVHDGCAELSFTEPLAQAPALGSEVCDTRDRKS